jgi:hypothetical protein
MEYINERRREGGYSAKKWKDEIEIQREALDLWRRLNRCVPYKKYRDRKPKETQSSLDIKWPEHMEIAFCKGGHRPFSFPTDPLTL